VLMGPTLHHVLPGGDLRPWESLLLLINSSVSFPLIRGNELCHQTALLLNSKRR
jgi:hypothetical protein